MPSELQPLPPLQTSLNKAVLAAASNAGSSLNAEYDKLLAPDAAAPAPPVYAARLSGLLKNLASASGAVAESIKARKALAQELQKLLDANQATLKTEEAQVEDLEAKKATAEAKKRKVEDEILKGLPSDTANVALEGQGGGNAERNAADEDDDRPQMEALTPPPVESFTPLDQSPAGRNGGEPAETAFHTQIPAARPSDGGNHDGGMFKKRKLDSGKPELMSVDAMADLDDDVAELLRSEGGGR